MKYQAKKIEVVDTIITAIDWIKKHREVVISISVVIIAGIVLVVFIISRQSNIKKDAWDKLALAQGYLYNNLPNQALQLLDQITLQTGKTTAAQYARLIKADIKYKNEEYRQCVDIYKEAIRIGKPKNIIPFAYLGLGNSLESLGNLEEAAKTYKELLDKFSDHYFVGRTYESLARIYELTGALEEAKQTYGRLITLYPATQWSQKAQERMSALSGPPPVSQRPIPARKPIETKKTGIPIPEAPATGELPEEIMKIIAPPEPEKTASPPKPEKITPPAGPAVPGQTEKQPVPVEVEKTMPSEKSIETPTE